MQAVVDFSQAIIPYSAFFMAQYYFQYSALFEAATVYIGGLVTEKAVSKLEK